MKNIKKQRSVVPIYLVALLWAIGGFGFRIHTVFQILLFVLLSAVILVAGNFAFRGRTVQAEQDEDEYEDYEDEEPEVDEVAEEPAAAPVYEVPEDLEVRAMRAERDRAIAEMRRINTHISDVVVSRQINRMESTTDEIFSYVARRPEQKTQVRRFLNYYLPTTLKLLGTYDRLSDASSTATNVDGAKKKIGDLMTTIVQSFDHLLDALRRGENLDIKAEVQVLYNVLNEGGHGKEKK